jgi:hypothetical protein
MPLLCGYFLVTVTIAFLVLDTFLFVLGCLAGRLVFGDIFSLNADAIRSTLGVLVWRRAF